MQLSRKCNVNPENRTVYRARLVHVDASGRAGLAPQLHFRSRYVSSLYFSTVLSTLDVTHMIKCSLPELRWACGFKGHMLELLYTHEYTQGERAWERGYMLIIFTVNTKCINPRSGLTYSSGGKWDDRECHMTTYLEPTCTVKRDTT